MYGGLVAIRVSWVGMCGVPDVSGSRGQMGLSHLEAKVEAQIG